MKYISLFTLVLFLVFNSSDSYSECKDYINKRGDSFWYHEIVNSTSVIDDNETERFWKTSSDVNNCYISSQKEINDPTLRFLGYLNALWKLSEKLDTDNSVKIKELTGIEFSSSEQMQNWLRENRANLFWSFERNKMILLKGGFTCRGVKPVSGSTYWKKLALKSLYNMDTSSTQRLWRDKFNHSNCYITSLESINNKYDRLSGYNEAINSIISDNDGKLKVDSKVNEIFENVAGISGKDFKSYEQFVIWLSYFKAQ
jgi:hypothetical protein